MIYKRCNCTTACTHAFEYSFELRGIRYRRSTRTANKQLALRIEARRRAAILEGRDEEEKPQVTLAHHIKDYCEFTAKKNITGYKDADVLSRLLDAVRDRPLGEVSPFHIERWKTARASHVERSTVNRELNIVRGCFARAVEWKRLAVSPVVGVRTFQTDDIRLRVLDDEEVGALMRGDGWSQLVCRVTLECLPRLSEVLGIHRSHIGQGWVEVRRKGGRVDRIAIASSLREKLLAQAHPESGYVFGEGPKGEPPPEQRASLRVSRWLKRLGIKNASHHTMRHTGVTLMLERGVNPRAIQKLAGWGTLRMLERYGHARDAEMQRAVTGNAKYLEEMPREEAPEAEGRSIPAQQVSR